MFQLIVQFQETHVFEFDGLPTGREIKDKLFEEEGVPADLISLSTNDCDLLDEDLVNDIEALTVRASLLSGLCGGKGGFGAQLRALAKQKAYRKTTDFGACRDLSGRRLRHVNDEILLQKWQEAKDKGEAFEPDGETATGIDLWYLSAPSWAEGVKVDKRKIFMKPRMKTAMCIDWKRARENRPAPEGAPAHWGCPRGRRCEFAHGVEELRGESQQALLDAKQQEKRDAQSKKKDDYMGVLYRSNKEEEELEDLVMAGLRAAKRAKLNTSNTTDTNTTETTNTTNNTTTLTENDDAAVASDNEGLEDTADSVEDEEVVSLDYFTALSGTVVVAKATTSTSTSSTSNHTTLDTATVCPIVTGTSAFATVVVDKLTLQAHTIPTTTTTTTTTTTNTTSPSRWYYEVELQSDGLMQLGWVDSQFIANFYNTQAALPINNANTTTNTTTRTTNTDTTNTTTTSDTPAVEADGVGDDAHSWAYDGYRQQRWHGGESSAYGPQTGKIWQAGDVVGCYLELYGTSVSGGSNSDDGDGKGKDKKRKAGTSADDTTTSTTTGAISYSLNGVHFGTAFDISITTTNTSGSTSTSELLFYPAFSLEDSESVLLNLGSKPFKYDPCVVYSGCTSVSTSSGKKGTPAKGKKGASSSVSATDKESVVFTSVWEAVLQASGASVTTIDTATTTTTATTSTDTTTTTNPITTTTTTTTSTPEAEHTPIHLEDALYSTPESLESLGLANLKLELTLRGMKTGGTLQERALRLFSVRGVEVGKIDAKLLAKKA